MDDRLTEKGLEGVYTLEGVSFPTAPVKCLYCGLEIPRQRKGKKFCNKKHRWLFHNAAGVKEKNELKAFAEEINDLLEKHGLLRNRNGGSIHE